MCSPFVAKFSDKECTQHRCTHYCGIRLSCYEVLGPEAINWPTGNGIGFVIEQEWTGDVCSCIGCRRFKVWILKLMFEGKFAISRKRFLNPDGIYLWSWRMWKFKMLSYRMIWRGMAGKALQESCKGAVRSLDLQ